MTMERFLAMMAGGMALIFLAMIVTGAAAKADPLPQRKYGQCPMDHRDSGGGYCVPTRRDSPRAVPKAKGYQCPTGWRDTGAYCQDMAKGN